MNLAGFLHRWAAATPGAPAVALGREVVHDYAGLAARVARLAGGLRARGLVPGEHVALVMANVPEYWEALLACWHAGLAAVPVNARLHPQETAHILGHSRARLCLASPALAAGCGMPEGGEVLPVPSAGWSALAAADPVPMEPVAPDALAWLFYTSGTTGRPKGAMLTHRNLLAMALRYFTDIDEAPPWRAILHPAPLSHGSGLYGLAHLMKGSAQVIPVSGGFDPAEIFDLCAAWPGAVLFAAPTMVRRLTAWPGETRAEGLKAVIYGGAPMAVADVKAFLARFGPRLAQLYGQGESPMTISGMGTACFADTAHPRWEARIGSAGLPQAGVEIRIAGEDGAGLPPGAVGEVLCRSDAVMAGYWRDPEATARALAGGWLHTGDMGRLEPDGYLTLLDRSKDLIISGGSNIYPREVEEVLLTHPGVAEVSVIGRPDPDWGEAVVAWVVPAEGAQVGEAELDALCLAHIARFKRPRAYRMVAGLPKNNYGKILKTELRRMEADAPPPPRRGGG